MNGVQYPVQTTLGYPPLTVSGNFALSLQFRGINEDVYAPTGNVSLMYAVDNQPVGPVLNLSDGTSFAYGLDTTIFNDGTHSLSVMYVNETPQNPCVQFTGRQYTFVVANRGIVPGEQPLPVTMPPEGYGPLLPQFADWVLFPGYQPHAAAHPRAKEFIPPAGGTTPKDFWGEPLVYATSGAHEGMPEYSLLSNGSPIVETKYSDLLEFCDDRRKPLYGFDTQGPFWEQWKSRFDGQQNDASVSSYITLVPNLDGDGVYGIGMDGRLVLIGTDGSVETIAGWTGNRAVTPFDYLDNSIPSIIEEKEEVLVGTFDKPFYFPSDLAVDPGDHSHIYVADMNNHRIALADLSQSPPAITTFAGDSAGKSGYLDGQGTSAFFNQPSSLVFGPDGFLYVADAMNSVIRRIDTQANVTTVVGLGPNIEPDTVTVAKSPLKYAPNQTVPFASAYINYPNVVRFDSRGNLVLGESVTLAVRYIDLGQQTVTNIARLQNQGDAFGEQLWLDVDRNGNVGEKDDVIVSLVKAQQKGLYRVPITGTIAVPPPMLTAIATNPIYSGHTKNSSQPFTASPWTVAIDDIEGRLFLSGVHGSGVVSLRLLQSSDPAFQLQAPDYVAGRNVWFTGTVPNFPFGSRPSFAAVHGYEGYSGLGNVLNFDDMVSMTDTQLGAYLQSGADGSVPRPELTGNDLRNVVYYIRRTAVGGATATPAPSSADKTPPTISTIGASQSAPSSLTITWVTSEPSLGFVNWGTTSGTYFGWSELESGYSTSHSVTVTNLPAGEQIFFVVRAKDIAGNQRLSSEQTLTLY